MLQVPGTQVRSDAKETGNLPANAASIAIGALAPLEVP